MAAFMKKLEPQSYAALRIVAGFLFLWHGSQKLLGIPTDPPPGLPVFLAYTAGSVELIGGLLVMLGLFTSWAAFVASGLMAAAYWMAHGLHHPLPLLNKGELAALYCFVFLFISARGPGVWSLDSLRGS